MESGYWPKGAGFKAEIQFHFTQQPQDSNAPNTIPLGRYTCISAIEHLLRQKMGE
jgi:hypothetical protein